MNFEIYIGWLKLHSRVYTQQVMNFGIPDNSKQYNQYNINQRQEVHYPQVCLEFFFFFLVMSRIVSGLLVSIIS